MPDRRHTLAALALGGLAPAVAFGRDVKRSPEAVRRFASPSGAFELEVQGREGGGGPQVDARMFVLRSSGRRPLWTRPLPHRHGPALGLVSDDGTTLLVDEWIRTFSPYALMLLDPGGTTLGAYSAADIAAASGLPATELVVRATEGAWMSAPPARDGAHNRMVLEAGGVRLYLDMATAALSRAADGPAAPAPVPR